MTEKDFKRRIDAFTNDALKKKRMKPRPVQSAVALSSCALVEEKVNCIVKVGTGEGKSLISSMVGHLVLDKEEPVFDNVVVVSPTDILNAQANALWQPKSNWCRLASTAMGGFNSSVKVIYANVMELINLKMKQEEKARTLIIIDEIDAVTKDYMAVMRPVFGNSHLVTALGEFLDDFTVFATSATADSQVIEVLEVVNPSKDRVFLDFTTLGMTKPANDIHEVRVFEHEEGTDEQLQ